MYQIDEKDKKERFMNQEIYEELKKIARTQKVTYYAVVGRIIGLDMGNPSDRNKIAEILDEINYHEHKNERPMLSAVVIRQDINMPGEGFFKCARDIGKNWKGDNVSFWAHELTIVHNYWQSD